MKKIKSLFLAVFMIALTCCTLLLGGCAKSTTYKLHSIKINDEKTTSTISIGDKYEGIELKEDTIILILEEDKFVLRATTIQENSKVPTKPETEISMGEWIKGYKDEIYLCNQYGYAVIAKKDGNFIILTDTDKDKDILITLVKK